MNDEKIISTAKQVLHLEANAIEDLSKTLNLDFVSAVKAIVSCKSKIVFSGIGKSGQIARKLASTFSSTGSPSIFLHMAEAMHGDFGVLSKDDLLIVISYSGQGTDLSALLKYATRKSIKLVAITGNSKSILAQSSDICLNIQVKKEACPLGLAPTCSSTVSLALGDALAVSALELRGFKEENFAELHPGGSLGRRLLTKVSDLMHTKNLPFVDIEENFLKIMSVMTSSKVRGVVGVLKDSQLVGVITDGDIRVFLQTFTGDIKSQKASSIMSDSPKSILFNLLAEKALQKMEEFKIQTLFVLKECDAKNADFNTIIFAENKKQVVGLIHFQDLLQAKIL
ncbi:MAG: KpsF/GutQ family sugar-phosphate isomerase [Bdellovibrionales bacterium]|nr:KpsF/GutQ family sugar-phosphate isomerase [Bdellovibrionales bacterium]